MKRFLRDLGLFWVLQLALFALVETVFLRVYGRNGYLAAWFDKEARVEATAPPRILLVGGSGLPFGVDSGRLESALGRPVLNPGLHGGLGAGFMLRQAESFARAGDTVVLSIEPELFANPDRCDDTAWQLAELDPPSIRWIPPRAIPHLLDIGMHVAAERPRAVWFLVWGKKEDFDYYRRSAFDARGDMIAHLDLPTRHGGGMHVEVPSLRSAERVLAPFASSQRRLTARGVRVVMIPSVVPRDDYAAQATAFEALYASIERFTSTPVLRAPREALRRGLFLDSAHHLTGAGRRLNTERYRMLLASVLAGDTQARLAR